MTHDDGVAAARRLLPALDLRPLEVLGGSERSVVTRCSTDEGTVVVKAYTGADEGWLRESASLSVLPPAVPAPRLLAESAEPRLVVMSDVGAGGRRSGEPADVAQALLGRDPEAARAAVVDWARAVATLHRGTRDLGPAFDRALAEREGDLAAARSTVPQDMADTTAALQRLGANLGVTVTAAAVQGLYELGSELGPDSLDAALTPGDTCPDNNVVAEDGVRLLDFEGAEWRHVAWDVAYLTVPWPTCWCAWSLPADVTGRAISAYEEVAGPTDRAQVAASRTGWALWSAAQLLPRALDGDPPLLGSGRPAPSRRAFLLHRLGEAAAEQSALGDLAARFHRTLTRHWGDVPLPLAPAFRR